MAKSITVMNIPPRGGAGGELGEARWRAWRQQPALVVRS